MNGSRKSKRKADKLLGPLGCEERVRLATLPGLVERRTGSSSNRKDGGWPPAPRVRRRIWRLDDAPIRAAPQ